MKKKTLKKSKYTYQIVKYLQGEPKKKMISKNMAITTLKSIIKGKSWCVLENSASMLQDRSRIFQNWCKNGFEQLTGSWQPPSKNERKKKSDAVNFDLFLEGVCQLQVNFSKPFFHQF